MSLRGNPPLHHMRPVKQLAFVTMQEAAEAEAILYVLLCLALIPGCKEERVTESPCLPT